MRFYDVTVCETVENMFAIKSTSQFAYMLHLVIPLCDGMFQMIKVLKAVIWLLKISITFQSARSLPVVYDRSAHVDYEITKSFLY